MNMSDLIKDIEHMKIDTNSMETVVVTSDGHCLLYALSVSLAHFCNINLPTATILSHVYEESILNIDQYSPYVHELSHIPYHKRVN